MNCFGVLAANKNGRMAACICAVFIALGAAGCESRQGKAQALALVDGEAITVRHLQAAQEIDAGLVDAEGAALDVLIDRQLLTREAQRMALDRDPHVSLALEAAQARILADAYIERKIALHGKPGRNEVEEYFRKHPELFSQRKIIDFTLLAIGNADPQSKRIIDEAQSIDDVAAWLEGRHRPYVRHRLSRASSELPPPLASHVGEMESRRLFSMVDGTNTFVVEINGVSPSPLTREEALPRIERELLERKKEEFGRAEIARLRSLAKLEYLNRAATRIAGSRPAASGAGHVSSDVR